jgi:hypothetical protein
MPIYIGDYYERLNVLKKAKEGTTPSLISCLDSIDAALWLIAGNRVPQALVMLHNSIEIIFKSELERIDPSLIYIKKNSNTNKTISFNEALKQVAELYPLVNKWSNNLEKAKDSRNHIIHYGSKIDDFEKYVVQIVTILFPFLREFLQEIEVDLEKWLTSPVSREIEVALKTCEQLQKENKAIRRYILKTVSLIMFYQNVDFPRLSTITGVTDGEEEFEMTEIMEKRLEKEWDDSFVETSCRICDSISLFVKVEPSAHLQNSLRVLAAKCPHCGLDISEDELYLAEYHVGELDEDEIEKFLRECGEWVEK